ncbi:hypothetical protein Ancab_014720, partial [Ancistrocladus abbreviatus]
AIMQYKNGGEGPIGSWLNESPSSSYMRLSSGDSGRFQPSDMRFFGSESGSSMAQVIVATGTDLSTTTSHRLAKNPSVTPLKVVSSHQQCIIADSIGEHLCSVMMTTSHSEVLSTASGRPVMANHHSKLKEMEANDGPNFYKLTWLFCYLGGSGIGSILVLEYAPDSVGLVVGSLLGITCLTSHEGQSSRLRIPSLSLSAPHLTSLGFDSEKKGKKKKKEDSYVNGGNPWNSILAL